MPSITRRAMTIGALIGGLAAPGHRSPIAAQAARPSSSGSPLWHIEGRGWGTPAADQSTAYFLAASHELQARDIETGALRWSAHTGEPGPTTSGSSAFIAGDVVIAGDYNVVAFDRLDGALRWRFTPSEGYAPGMYLGAPAGDLVFAGSPAGRIYAIDHRTGNARWSHAVATDGSSTVFQPVTDGQLLVAGYTTFTAPNTGGIVAVDAATGREQWRTPFTASSETVLDTGWAGGPVLTDGEVIALSADGNVVAFDRRTGAIKWTLPKWTAANLEPADPRERDFRPLARAGDLLLVGSLSGEVIAYGLTDRIERWRYKSLRNGSVAFRLLADGGLVYIPYIDGCLVVVDADDGRERWRTGDAFTGFIWPPAIGGERVIAADFESGFFAFAR